MSFVTAFEKLIGHEGGYSNNPSDPGGETMYGVTKRVAVASGYLGAMRDLPLSRAREIAKAQYWDVWRGDDVDAMSPAIAFEMFDTLYNGGDPPTWLQRGLTAFNRQGRDYADLKPDGRIGPMTLFSLRKFLELRGKQGELAMLRLLNSIQGARYLDIAERNTKLEDFLFGWFVNRVHI